MSSSPPERRVRSLVRGRREQAGISQQALARLVGVSRQAMTAIEAGRQVPSTSLALLLAGALGCRVEDLFSLTAPETIEARLARDEDAGAHALDLGEKGGARRARRHPPRVLLGEVRGGWVAHPLRELRSGADGIFVGPEAPSPAHDDGRARLRPPHARVRLLDDRASASRNVLFAGCAPLLGVLSDMSVRRNRDVRVRWLPVNSHRALDLLDVDMVHVAGIHLLDEATGEENLPFVRRRFSEGMLVVNLTRWRQGIVVAPGNPLGLRDAPDLARPGLRVARREKGAGAAKLLERFVPDGAAEPLGPAARSHEEVAQLVEWGVADAGIAIESVAEARGLGFIPLTEESFDLVLRREVAAEKTVERALDMLTDSDFRAEAGALPGYDASAAGTTRLLP